MMRELQRVNDLRIIFSGCSVNHSACCRFRIFVRLHPAQTIQQILRHIQDICRLIQPAGSFVRVKLIDGVERLMLDARPAIEFFKRHPAVNLRNGSRRPAVPVCIAWQDFLFAFHQHIVHTPGIHRQADDVRILLQCFINTRLNVSDQRLEIPDELSAFLLHSVRKTVHLVGPDFPVLHPSDNMPPAGCPDINCQIVFHFNPPHPDSILWSERSPLFTLHSQLSSDIPPPLQTVPSVPQSVFRLPV